MRGIFSLLLSRWIPWSGCDLVDGEEGLGKLISARKCQMSLKDVYKFLLVTILAGKCKMSSKGVY